MTLAHKLSFTAILLAGTAAVGQLGQQPPMSTPPTFPSDSGQSDGKSLPPAHEEKSQEGLSTHEVQDQMDKKLATEPELKGVPVKTDVKDDSLTLSGSLQDAHQHDLVMRIATSFHGDRKIVDHTTVAGQSAEVLSSTK